MLMGPHIYLWRLKMEKQNMEVFKTNYEKLIYIRTYSRWIEELKRREYWNETVDRYRDFFIDRIPKSHQKDFTDICSSIQNLEIMPSMRALWTSGKALDRENIAGFNCASTPIDSIKAFSELLYILLNLYWFYEFWKSNWSYTRFKNGDVW